MTSFYPLLIFGLGHILCILNNKSLPGVKENFFVRRGRTDAVSKFIPSKSYRKLKHDDTILEKADNRTRHPLTCEN